MVKSRFAGLGVARKAIDTSQERFGLDLDPKRMHFVPLPSREIISDTYWKRFTLLGQSVGSIALAWEGLCGEDGLWGDAFIGA